MTLFRRIVVAALMLALAGSIAPQATAAPRTPSFGPAIDDSAGYDGQSKCSPAAKPGVLKFQRLVMNAYPGTSWGSISRACNVGGTSEHKEGRAWDWGVNVGSASDRRAVSNLLEWLFKTDRYGNEAALARRLGVMYLIWNRRIWFPWRGWETYCVQRRRGCVDPDDGGLRHPHTDHVHFSFTRAGAMGGTTYWTPKRSFVSGIAAAPWSDSYWLSGSNGWVRSSGAGWYGSKSGARLANPVVGIAPTRGGGGYWLATSAGKVIPFGDARRRGSATGVRAVDIEAAPNGRGYWLLTRSGRVLSFGRIGSFGNAAKENERVVGMAATPTGRGYWIFAADGRVFSYGDATRRRKARVGVVAGDNSGADGYWLVTRRGRVLNFGAAPSLGGVASRRLGSPIVDLAATASGQGYYLVSATGRVFRFGDA